MKTRIFLFTTLAALHCSWAWADKLTFEQLPPAVQNAVKAQAGTAPIEDIDRQVKDGKTTYEIAFKKNGQHTELNLGENGSLLDATWVRSQYDRP